LNKEQLDYIYTYLDNLARDLGKLETKVIEIENELLKSSKHDWLN